MSAPAAKSPPSEETGKFKSMVIILREENQVLQCMMYDLYS